jgi:hypothetical protein
VRLVLVIAGVLLAGSGCGRSIFVQSRPAVEKRSEIPGSSFRAIATIASDDSRDALRLSANVRARLNDAGITAHPASGRWDTEEQALADICQRTESPVDGVLLVSAAELKLTHCSTREIAFHVEGDASQGGPGIRHITERLIAYLQGAPPPAEEGEPDPPGGP